MLGPVDPVYRRNVTWLAGYRHPRHHGGGLLADALQEAFAEPAPLREGVRTIRGSAAGASRAVPCPAGGTAGGGPGGSDAGADAGVGPGGRVRAGSGMPGRPVVELGCQVRSGGRTWTVAALADGQVRLVAEDGAVAAVLLSLPFADAGFDVLDAPGVSGVPPLGLLQSLPEAVRERALAWERPCAGGGDGAAGRARRARVRGVRSTARRRGRRRSGRRRRRRSCRRPGCPPAR